MGGAFLPWLAQLGAGLVANALTAPAPALPSLPDLPSLPNLPDLPSLPTMEAKVLPTPPPAAAEAPISVAASYGAEMDDPGVACKPCTMRHLTTITEAARTAAGSADPQEWRRQVALIGAEALVWEQYDLTLGKLARADKATRDAVLAARPLVHEALAGVSLPPDRLLRSWGALLECRRFAEGRAPTARDQEQIALRLADTYGWIGYLESTDRAALGRHLDGLREARHRLAQDGPTPEALAFAEGRAGEAAVALTPAPSAQQVQDLYRRAKAARDGFFRAAMGRPHQEQRARFDPSQWITDRDALVPARYRDMAAAAHATTQPQQGLLGATPATAAAWTNLLRFARDTGVTVRERQLPAGFDGIVKGAYSASDNVLLLGPAATAEDSDGLQTLVHELVHATLHNPRCLPHPTPHGAYEADYEGSVEEREADAATWLTMAMLRLPIEHDDGTGAPAPEPKVAEAALREDLDPETLRRVTWAADLLAKAARGDASAVGMARACPVRASMTVATPKPAARLKPTKRQVQRRRRTLPGGTLADAYLQIAGERRGPLLYHVTREVNARLIEQDGILAGQPYAEGGFAAAAAEAELADEDLDDFEGDDETRARDAFNSFMNDAARQQRGKPQHDSATFFWNNQEAARRAKRQLERFWGEGSGRIVVVDSSDVPGTLWDGDWELSDQLFDLCLQDPETAYDCTEGMVENEDDCADFDELAQRYYTEMKPWDGNRESGREIICSCDIPPNAIVRIV